MTDHHQQPRPNPANVWRVRPRPSLRLRTGALFGADRTLLYRRSQPSVGAGSVVIQGLGPPATGTSTPAHAGSSQPLRPSRPDPSRHNRHYRTWRQQPGFAPPSCPESQELHASDPDAYVSARCMVMSGTSLNLMHKTWGLTNVGSRVKSAADRPRLQPIAPGTAPPVGSRRRTDGAIRCKHTCGRPGLVAGAVSPRSWATHKGRESPSAVGARSAQIARAFHRRSFQTQPAGRAGVLPFVSLCASPPAHNPPGIRQ